MTFLRRSHSFCLNILPSFIIALDMYVCRSMEYCVSQWSRNNFSLKINIMLFSSCLNWINRVKFSWGHLFFCYFIVDPMAMMSDGLGMWNIPVRVVSNSTCDFWAFCDSTRNRMKWNCNGHARAIIQQLIKM